MDERREQTLTDRYIGSAPRVRAACKVIVHRYGLQWHDRLDLEQELWLALIVEWRRRDEADVAGTDILLPNELDWIWGRWLGGTTDNECGVREDRLPLLAGALPSTQLAVSDDAFIDTIRRIDLRLDITELLNCLSAEDRSYCQRLIAAVSTMTDVSASESFSLQPSSIEVLRRAFEAHGLRDYL